MIQETYRETVKALSDRIVAAQRPIRVLTAVNWDDQVRSRFFESGFTEQPAVDRDYYLDRAVRLKPAATREELAAIGADVLVALDEDDPTRRLMLFMVEQFTRTVDMIEARGTADFSRISTELYGSPFDTFHEGGPRVCDLSATMRATFEANAHHLRAAVDDRVIPGPEAVARLRAQLDASVGRGKIDVRSDDRIASDAAAGSDYIKMREDRLFSQRDIDLLEAHEGWVHVSTTLNGLAQPVCTFLGKAAPRTTVTQEGLAVLTEMLNLRSHPRRLAKLMRRIDAIRLAAEGATFVDVFEAMRTDGLSEGDAWVTTSRVFRGSLPMAGPFTKDLGYGKGLILTLMYVRMAIRFGKPERIPYLFCGKVDLLDMAAVHHLEEEGLVVPPDFVAPPFDDIPALATTLALGRFTSQLDVDALSVEYEKYF